MWEKDGRLLLAHKLSALSFPFTFFIGKLLSVRYIMNILYFVLQDYLLELQNDPIKSRICKQRVLCRTLAGNLVYVLTITSASQNPEDAKVSVFQFCTRWFDLIEVWKNKKSLKCRDWFCLLLDFSLGKEILQCILLEFPDFKARGGTNILEFILFECVLDLLHFFCSIKYVKSMCCVAFVNFKFIYFSRRAHSHPKPSIPHSWNQR